MAFNTKEGHCQICNKRFKLVDERWYITERRFVHEANKNGWRIKPFLCPECRKEIEDE